MTFKRFYITLLFLIPILFLKGQKIDNNGFLPNKFLPNNVKLQYAGGIGLMSVGIGYTFLKQRLDVTLFYGYVPKIFSVSSLHSVSLQTTLKLIKIKVNKNIEILPLNFGWYLHHTFNKEFWLKQPNYYPKGYYWWSPGRNAGIFFSNEIRTKLFSNNMPASGIAFYFRVGTRGLYISSIWNNSTIPLKDILELGFGIVFYR